MQDHAAHIVSTAHLSESAMTVLTSMFRALLAPTTSNSSANSDVCRHLINTIFERWISDDDSGTRSLPAQYLETLTLFANAKPQLFKADQMRPLQPYINNVSNTDEPIVYRSVVIIYRHTFPLLTSNHEKFMFPVQQKLLKNLQKLGKTELDEVTMCLQIINNVLSDTDRLVNLTISVLDGIRAIRNKDFNTQSPAVARDQGKLERIVTLAGYFGKNFKLDMHRKTFQEKLRIQNCESVPAILVDTIFPLTSSSQPQSLRIYAVESVSLICQSSPKLYEIPKVSGLFDEIFRNQSWRHWSHRR